ncbi:hypothetical protein ACLOJK_035933 [Asimina triloba]
MSKGPEFGWEFVRVAAGIKTNSPSHWRDQAQLNPWNCENFGHKASESDVHVLFGPALMSPGPGMSYLNEGPRPLVGGRKQKNATFDSLSFII